MPDRDILRAHRIPVLLLLLYDLYHLYCSASDLSIYPFTGTLCAHLYCSASLSTFSSTTNLRGLAKLRALALWNLRSSETAPVWTTCCVLFFAFVINLLFASFQLMI